MDDFEKLIKDSQEEIKPSEVNNAKAIYSKANVTPTKKPLPFKLIFVNAFILLLALGFFVVAMVNNNKGSKANTERNYSSPNTERNYLNPDNKETQLIETEPIIESEFTTFSSEEELKSYLSKTNTSISSLQLYMKDENTAESEPTATPTENLNGNDTTSYYQTNTREENVDEADIVKVNSNYIFYLSKSYNRVQIYKHSNGSLEFYRSILFRSNGKQVSEDDTYIVVEKKSYYANSLYLTEKYVIVQVEVRKSDVIYLKAGKTDSYTGLENPTDQDIVLKENYSNYRYNTEFLIYDSETCELLKTIDTVGSNNFTRLIGNDFYIANSYYINNNSFNYPCITVDDVVYSCEANQIYYFTNQYYNNCITSIYRLSLDDMQVENINAFASRTSNIYMTDKAIYLISNRYQYQYDEAIEGNYKESYTYSDLVTINIEGALEVTGHLIVEGTINDHYHIDENDNYLRMVTTGYVYKQWYYQDKYLMKSENKRFIYLTIFEKTDEGYKKISQITEGIGKPNEQLKSVRFNGDVVTVVTFKQTDPLYYIDLTNPYEPVITSEYEITGYSAYQFPYKDGYVVGIGYEVINDRNAGIKITLFDARDKNDIKAVGKSYVIKYGTYNANGYTYYEGKDVEALYNPKALLINKEEGIFGFNAKTQTHNKDIKYLSEYFLFRIDMDNECPITLLKKESISTDTYSAYSYRFNRMVYVNNDYYLLSDNDVKVYKYENGEFKYIKDVNAE